MHEPFYNNQLYPLQDQVLARLNKTRTDFYLTGGTALSRAYFNHRYSDDLDFFVNDADNFREQLDEVLHALDGLEITSSLLDNTYGRIFIQQQGTALKVDFVNDVAYRVGRTERTKLCERTDNVRNILTNKLCALSRGEPKDVADILTISLNTHFEWREAVHQAKQKDIGVNELDIAAWLHDFPVDYLTEVKWTRPVNPDEAQAWLQVISLDVLRGKANSLVK